METTAGPTTLDSQIRTLSDQLDGHLLLPGDDGYDQARTVWNAMIDRRPRLIVRCASAADVATAVRFARAHDLTIGVRCGGHGIAGLAVPDGGLMIDLTPLAAVRVDPDRRRAWVQGGAMLGALDHAAQEHGLATTAGNVSHTGVGGLTLGGGMGWLARQHGLTCDNVVSFTMVTADGELLVASETENPELYWGLRGGGGNFGIVTEFEFRLHPVGTQALLVDFSFPVEDAFPVLRGWRDLNAEAPRRATFTAGISGATGAPVVHVGFVWVGDPDEGRRLLPALRALGQPVAERVEELSYLRLHAALGEAPRYGTARCAAYMQDLRSNPDWKARAAERLPPEIAEETPLDLFGLITGLPAETAQIPWDGPKVRIIEHPAHAPGHAALLIEERRVLVAGDMLSDVLIPMLDNWNNANDPIEEYLVGLRLLEGVADDVDVLIPGHGSVGRGDQVRARINQDRAYVHALRDGDAPDDPRIGPSAKPGWEWVSDIHEGQAQSLARRIERDGTP